METAKISRTLLDRLPRYLEYLKQLSEEDATVSATSIAAALNTGEVQVRKDLARIAGEGRCRTGRFRNQLIATIETFLDESFCTTAILVCDGSREMPENCNFAPYGVNVVACFDLCPSRKCTPCGRPVYSINRLEGFSKRYRVAHGIIAASGEGAQTICDCLIACGIKSIWNLTPVSLTVPSGISLRNGLDPA